LYEVGQVVEFDEGHEPPKGKDGVVRHFKAVEGSQPGASPADWRAPHSDEHGPARTDTDQGKGKDGKDGKNGKDSKDKLTA